MKILVTGCAGFIGSHITDKLLGEGYDVVGVDNFNDYYDPKIKEANISSARKSPKFKIFRLDILDFEKLTEIFAREKPKKVVHAAARAGVRPSIADPFLYARVNCLGTVNLLRASTFSGVRQFIYTSSSSVYGKSKKIPFSEIDLCQDIVSPYAASKRSAEFFVESFSKNFGLKSTILRLFTVYGERGRPDMAPAKFTRAVLEGETIEQFGDGSSSRDYTYISDIVEGIILATASEFDFEIINLGNNHPVKLSEFIKMLEKITGKKANIKVLPAQIGDVETTWAKIDKARKLLSWKPKVNLQDGLKKYISSL